MKKSLSLLVAIAFTLSLFAMSTGAEAAKREKFGTDTRHKIVKRLKVETSSEKPIKWKMVMPWSKGLLFFDYAQHFSDSVRLASGGRLLIKCFSAGELVPAMQSFDAVSKGSAQCMHDWPGYWKGKNEAFVAFAAVPMGLDAELYNVWLYERGGAEMMNELYGRYNMVALPGGQCGQEMGLLSNKAATKLKDFKGLKVRTAGWFMDIMTMMGASATPIPGGEVYLALERGVIDAAEFSSPSLNYPMGFDEITKYVIEPGVHQPSSQFGFAFNTDAWNKLPEDLKWIVKTCAKETQLWSYSWTTNLDIKAIKLFKKNVEFLKMDKETIIAFKKTAKTHLDSLKAKYPDVKKALDSQETLIDDFADWREIRSGITPWPYQTFIDGKTN